MQKKLILVSNDDGINAKGLKHLIEMVRPYGELLVVAPENHQSGMSHSISILKPLRANLVHKEEGMMFYSVPGTPVDCVKMALNRLAPRKPDLMVSGINHGSNSAVSVIYSGTIGAAIEASLYDIPSIGFSVLNHAPDANFSIVQKNGGKVIDAVLANGLPKNVAFNVNFPNIDPDDFRGFKICRQAKGVWREEFVEHTDPYGMKYYWLSGNFENFEHCAEDTDEWALKNNYASVVPVHADLTSHKTIDIIRNWKL
ncbi:MAG: 5'/3'-nucleotidase SurE [Bacteroidales bacterium]|nr:5'/3'-nucleotidase SurE [Bacteroidales bacterium]HOY38731.1 5'/3'-nucleotidase SurE [Bacteroidales bacterium]HQP03494.1 5'/3'-nucleotidase SurE [Bacteroidales bacterium]